MAASQIRAITQDDLSQAVRSITQAFDCEEIVIIGSQALLVGKEDIATDLRQSREIDLYPKSFRSKKSSDDMEISEKINALLERVATSIGNLDFSSME